MKHYLILVASLFVIPIARAQLAANPETTEGPYYPFNTTQTLSTTALVDADNRWSNDPSQWHSLFAFWHSRELIR